VFILMLIACVATYLASCQTPKAIEQPQRAWIDASRKVYEVVAPRFQTYVMHDDTLDQVTKDQLLKTVSDWEFMVRQGELWVPNSTPLPVRGPR
jgi:hypothetical protein